MRIIAIRGTHGPSGDYRVALPLEMMRRRGHEVLVLDAEDGARLSRVCFADWDVCILQLLHQPGIVGDLRQIPDSRRPTLVYEVDDYMWGLPRYRHGALWLEKFRPGYKACMEGCDAVFTSTPELANRIRPYNPNVRVLLNSIDYSIRDWQTPYQPRLGGGRTIIGWAGGIRPDRDMAVMGSALVDVLEAEPQAAFAIAGDEEQCFEFAYTLGFRERHLEQLCILPLSPFFSYPQLVSLFDIGIAPIEDTEFNRCKSELKLMEYGAWGIPYVASDVAPYRRFHERSLGICGYLARTAGDWSKALRLLVLDSETRHSRGGWLQSFVRKSYNLDTYADEWERQLRSVAKRESYREMAVR